MAYKILIQAASGKKLFYINNFSAVGNGGGANRWRSDIQLVQYFLNDYFQEHPELFKKLPPSRSHGNEINIDGICGKRTIAAIQIFQERNSDKFKVDGRVSVPRYGQTFSENGHAHKWTILGLNTWWKTKGSGKKVANLEDDLRVVKAPELLSDLKRCKEPLLMDW